MTDFRDAIAIALSDHFNANRGPWPIHATPEHQRGYADAVLAMPEMQAIRAALLTIAEADRYEWGTVTLPHDSLASLYLLPPAVVAWVLGDNP